MSKEFGFTIEGECLVGKSEALKQMRKLSRFDIYIVPEYFEIGQLTNFSRRDLADVKHIQNEIMELEKRRTDMATTYLARHPTSILGFDRSYLSCLAFEWSMKHHGCLDGYDYLLEKLIRETEDENIILPTQVLHLTANPATIEKRRVVHLSKGHGNVSDFLRDLDVRQTQIKYIREKGIGLYNGAYRQIVTDNLNQKQVAKLCLDHVDNKPEFTRVNLDILYQYECA